MQLLRDGRKLGRLKKTEIIQIIARRKDFSTVLSRSQSWQKLEFDWSTYEVTWARLWTRDLCGESGAQKKNPWIEMSLLFVLQLRIEVNSWCRGREVVSVCWSSGPGGIRGRHEGWMAPMTHVTVIGIRLQVNTSTPSGPYTFIYLNIFPSIASFITQRKVCCDIWTSTRPLLQHPSTTCPRFSADLDNEIKHVKRLSAVTWLSWWLPWCLICIVYSPPPI